jgi:hypothetical protein
MTTLRCRICGCSLSPIEIQLERGNCEWCESRSKKVQKRLESRRSISWNEKEKVLKEERK